MNNSQNLHDSGTRIPSGERSHLGRIFHWEANEWIKEPGANCPSLDPPCSGVVKTFPDASHSVFPGKLPPLQDEVRTVNGAYLELTSGLKNNKWFVMIPGILGLPAFLVFSVVLVSYTFSGRALSEDLGVKLFMLFILALGLITIYSLFTIAVFSPEDEPIRFSRRDNKIYRYQARRWRWLGMDVYHPGSKAKVEVYDWKNCRAEVIRKTISTGSSIRSECTLELAILDTADGKVTKRFRIGDRDLYSDFAVRVFLWETVRRYMENGPGHIPPPVLQVHRETMADCIEEFNPFSLPAKSAPGAQKAISYVLATLMWIALLPSLLIVLSRWSAFKVGRKIHWGDLENSVFRIDEDSSRHSASLPTAVEPVMWAAELKRRQRAAWFWTGSILLQIAAIAWFLSIPRYYH